MKKRIIYPLNCFVLGALCIAIVSSCNNTNRDSKQSNDNEEIVQEKQTTLTQIWKTDSTFTGSESTLYHPDNNIIYVSCGNTSKKDGDGFIALLNTDGSVKDMQWVTGLNAPKGMAILNGKLYVTDVNEIKVINIETANIEKTIPVNKAEFLNDLASDGTTIYFSDSKAGIVYSLNQNGNVTAVINNVEGVNGVACYEGDLYTLDKKGLKRYDTKEYRSSLLNSKVTGGDGLVILNDTTFIASRWEGEIYFIKGNETTLLLDTKDDKSNTADIGFIPNKNLVLVPTFMKNEVAAYELK